MKQLIYFSGLIFIFLSSCVESEFDIPEESSVDPTITGTEVSIASVKNALTQSTEDIVSFANTDNYFIGYVISSDTAGNFFKELILQDKPENPSSGISVQINQNAIYTYFEPGRKMYIHLDGLSVTTENGTVQLGIRDGNSISEIPTSLISKHLTRSSEIATLIPLPIAISDFSDDTENLFVSLANAQFNRNEVLATAAKTFAGESTDEFDGIRILETCNTPGRTLVSTSTFARFKSVQLPSGSGNITGILSRDFYDDFYILRLNTPEDITFNPEIRCDPDLLKCGISATEGTKILFEEDFSAQKRNKPIEGKGWTNFNEYGNQVWEAYTATGTNASQGVSARIDSYQSGDALTLCWLITPAIDLETNSNVRIRFETSSSFADGSDLEVLFSSDWDGNDASITAANWLVLDDAFIIRDQDFFGDWYSSGIVTISCEANLKGYIAFKYTGSTKDAFDGTYQLDNIMITAD